MKVIKEGTKPEETPRKATCRHCKSKLEFTRQDGRIVYDQRDGNALVVKCPVCDNELWVAL